MHHILEAPLVGSVLELKPRALLRARYHGMGWALDKRARKTPPFEEQFLLVRGVADSIYGA